MKQLYRNKSVCAEIGGMWNTTCLSVIEVNTSVIPANVFCDGLLFESTTFWVKQYLVSSFVKKKKNQWANQRLNGLHFVRFKCWSKVEGCGNSCVAGRQGKRSHNILDPSSLLMGKSLGVEFVSDWQAKSSCCRCFHSPDVQYRSSWAWTWTQTENDLIYFWCFTRIPGRALRVYMNWKPSL